MDPENETETTNGETIGRFKKIAKDIGNKLSILEIPENKNNFGKVETATASSPPISKYSKNYCMSRPQRGLCLIFAFETFQDKLGLNRRSCARIDSQKCKDTFYRLGYQVIEYRDLSSYDFSDEMRKVGTDDHTDRDSLVVVFMSHGGMSENKSDIVYTHDSKMLTSSIWKSFTADKCPTLAGKPKLFFIQACRGEESDKGVQMMGRGRRPGSGGGGPLFEQYVIPSHSDILVMWATYKGHFAFKSNRSDIDGSIFIHYLTSIIDDMTYDEVTRSQEDLMSILLAVTRSVALEYCSCVPNNPKIDQNKQIPVIVSTLMRKMYFRFSKEEQNGDKTEELADTEEQEHEHTPSISESDNSPSISNR